MNEEPTITLKVSRFLSYVLGNTENTPIEKEEATVLDILKIPSVHIQWCELDEPHTKFNRPLLWNWKAWQNYTKNQERKKYESMVRRNAALKQSDNINRVVKHLCTKFCLPESLARPAAQKMILDRTADKELLRACGITIESLNQEESSMLDSRYTFL